MNNFYSPLRYPGGKSRLAPFIAKICLDNALTQRYIEPYSGGGSVALFLLLEGIVEDIIINDKDRSIYAFWHSLLNHTTQFCDMIQNCEVSIEEWKRQKAIQTHKNQVSLLDLAFSTFFLNRTNRSGIINGGVIGGQSQNGHYLLNCRFNKDELISRILTIASKRKHIRIYKKDAISLINILYNRNLITKDSLIYFDPPYYIKGPSLYMNHYTSRDHEKVRDAISSIYQCKWIVSYDPTDEIKKLYSSFRKIEYELIHFAHTSKRGTEILFFSDNIEVIDFSRNPSLYRISNNQGPKSIVYGRE